MFNIIFDINMRRTVKSKQYYMAHYLAYYSIYIHNLSIKCSFLLIVLCIFVAMLS